MDDFNDIIAMNLQTPPRTPFKSTDGLSPDKQSSVQIRSKSPADSGVGDVLDDAQKDIMPEDPFDSQHNRILFDAIDALQSFGAGELSIPQVYTIKCAKR